MADKGFVSEATEREDGVVGSACCEGSAARHTSIDVEWYCVPVVLVNEEIAVGGGEEMIEPSQILAELGREGDQCSGHCLRESNILLRNRQA